MESLKWNRAAMHTKDAFGRSSSDIDTYKIRLKVNFIPQKAIGLAAKVYSRKVIAAACEVTAAAVNNWRKIPEF